MSGECVIFSVLSHHSKDLKQWTSVIAQLQFSFIWQVKGSTPLRHEVRSTPKGEASLLLGFLFIYASLLPHLSCPMHVALAKKGACLFHLKFSHSCLWIFFCSIFAGFSLSLSFSHHHFGLLFPILTT